MSKHKYIGIFGMMGSGKSVIMNEYLLERPKARELEFHPPPVEAKFRGMDFEFVDQIFAIKKNGITFNFYELDAPTINKWTQFIEVANAIIIAYNYTKEDYFESPSKFIDNIITYSKESIPIYFVVNMCSDLSAAKKKLEKEFKLSQVTNREFDIRVIPEADIEYTKEHGRRVKIDIQLLDNLYSSVIDDLLSN